MGFFSLLIYVLAAGISVVIAQGLPDGPVIPTHRAPFDGTSKTVITLDWLFSTGGEVESASASAKLVSSVPEKVSKMTICAQKCSVLTLSTVAWQSGKAKTSPDTPSAVATSCITIYDSLVPPPEPSSSTPSSTSCTTSSTSISLWSWPRPLTSSETTATAVSPAEVPTGTSVKTVTTEREDDVSGSEPCTTEITVTLTTTIIETWQSKTPITTTLVRTRSTTIETVVVEVYSTSTGERVVEGTRTATTTLHTASSNGDCVQLENCCAACSVTVVSGKVAAISSSVITGSATTVGYLPSSAGGGGGGGESVSWQDESLVPSPTGYSASESPDAQTETETETETASDSASGTAGPTSIQTAGAASVTAAAVGIGALLGIMGLLA